MGVAAEPSAIQPGNSFFFHLMKTLPRGLKDRNHEVLLILGTDLAGKDHFANVLTDAAGLAGIAVERRRGRFSGRPDARRTSEGKGVVKLCMEWIFLATLPIYCRLVPYVIAVLVRCDLVLYRAPKDVSLIVVSHTGLRLLAFALGHIFDNVEDIRLPAAVDAALRTLAPVTGAHTVVLDVDHEVRAARLEERSRRGTVDFFDSYMEKDPVRSERIESFLVWLGMTYLGAVRIENNNLSEAELLASLPPELRRHCSAKA